MRSGLLVAANTSTPLSHSTPSNSVNSWLTLIAAAIAEGKAGSSGLHCNSERLQQQVGSCHGRRGKV
jgi:hypothetical protein